MPTSGVSPMAHSEGHALSDEHEAQARARLGTVIREKYRLDEILGMGGMAVVYKATHRNKAEFAVKMLHPDLCARQTVRTRFLREGYAANSVKHPGAVKVVDDDVAEDGSAFLVMELLDGDSADRILARPGGPPTVHVAAGIGLQLLDVLAAAHASGIVHRDIKPANLFLTRDGAVKVLDFGIARALDESGGGAQLTGPGMPLGTPSFMAPEQALAKSDEIDAQTDVWAAGATLFALITGEMVHAGTTTAQVLVAAATAPARSLAVAAPHVAAPIVAVVDRALAFDKAARWANAGDMRDALGAACASAGIKASDTAALAGLFTGAWVGQRSNHPAAFAPTAENVPSQSAAGASGEGMAPAVASTGHPDGVGRRARPRRLALALGAAVLVSAAALSAVALRRSRTADTERSAAPTAMASSPASPTKSRTQVLILAISNQTGDPLFEGTVAMLLGHAVGRSAVISAPPPASQRSLAAELDAGTKDFDESLAHALQARDGGRVVTVRGTVAPKGAGYTASIVATDASSGAPVFTGSRDAAPGASVVPAIGLLASDLRAALGDTPTTDAGVADPTGMSNSLEADHEVLVGSALVNTGKYDESIVYLRHAVGLDPGFGVAHWVLSNVLMNVGKSVEARRELELAVQTSDTMTELERAELQADYFEAIGASDRAIAPLEDALRRDPGNLHVENSLTGEYVSTFQTKRALELARKTVEEHPTQVIGWTNLAGIEVRASEPDQAFETAQKTFAQFPSPRPRTFVYLALAEAMRGHPAEANDAYRKLLKRDASIATHGLADLALSEGRLTDAEALLRGGIDANVAEKNLDDAASKRVLLAEELLRRGDRAGALAAARKATQGTDAPTLFVAGQVEVETGDVQSALAIADGLDKSTPQAERIFGKLLDAEVLRKRGKASEAVARLEEAKEIGDSWLGHLSLVRAYLDLGEYALAEREIEECIARRGEGALALGSNTPSLRLLPPLTYYLARALDGLHRPEAKATYEAFLGRMAQGQHEPLVDDARQRLSRL